MLYVIINLFVFLIYIQIIWGCTFFFVIIRRGLRILRGVFSLIFYLLVLRLYFILNNIVGVIGYVLLLETPIKAAPVLVQWFVVEFGDLYTVNKGSDKWFLQRKFPCWVPRKFRNCRSHAQPIIWGLFWHKNLLVNAKELKLEIFIFGVLNIVCSRCIHIAYHRLTFLFCISRRRTCCRNLCKNSESCGLI